MRKFYYQGSADYITGATGGVQTEEYQTQFNTEFNNGDFFNTEVTRSFEAIVTPFEIARGVTVPAGEYRFTQGKASYQMGLQRRISGAITARLRQLLRRHPDRVHLARPGRVHAPALRRADPVVEPDRLAPYGNGNANLAATRLTYTVTPRMFVAALVQYTSLTASMSTNLRFRWEYQPGSELFVVYSDGRTTVGPHYPELQSRSVVVKVTKLFRW